MGTDEMPFFTSGSKESCPLADEWGTAEALRRSLAPHLGDSVGLALVNRVGYAIPQDKSRHCYSSVEVAWVHK